MCRHRNSCSSTNQTRTYILPAGHDLQLDFPDQPNEAPPLFVYVFTAPVERSDDPELAEYLPAPQTVQQVQGSQGWNGAISNAPCSNRHRWPGFAGCADRYKPSAETTDLDHALCQG
ncbi:unnamed protein product [Polarella glacialis]|uniref:Uncharacterized protein n=1 Tax=Polarella glacialis TaxID=89957 RepID=A0A813DS09_POLGL|nr:unnamed protein product [Polarella glacialis]